jgi:hypothetical protein
VRHFNSTALFLPSVDDIAMKPLHVPAIMRTIMLAKTGSLLRLQREDSRRVTEKAAALQAASLGIAQM